MMVHWRVQPVLNAAVVPGLVAADGTVAGHGNGYCRLWPKPGSGRGGCRAVLVLAGLGLTTLSLAALSVSGVLAVTYDVSALVHSLTIGTCGARRNFAASRRALAPVSLRFTQDETAIAARCYRKTTTAPRL